MLVKFDIEWQEHPEYFIDDGGPYVKFKPDTPQFIIDSYNHYKEQIKHAIEVMGDVDEEED